MNNMLNNEIQRALAAEKKLKTKNLLFITFHEQILTKNSIKFLHNGIKDVHILHPAIMPKRKCIIEIQEKANSNLLKDFLVHQSKIGNGFLSVECVKSFIDTSADIDPCKLHVRNLPISITSKEVEQLYPQCIRYKFIQPDWENTQSLLVEFPNVEEAITALKSTNLNSCHSNILIVQFHRRQSESEPEFDSDLNEDDFDESSEDEIIIEDEVFNEENEEFDFEEEDLEINYSDNDNNSSKINHTLNNSTPNQKLSDTLHVQNLPVNTTDKDLEALFPQCFQYKFLSPTPRKKKIKSALVRFHNIEEAVRNYNTSQNISFQSNVLHIEYYEDYHNNSFDDEIIDLEITDDENNCDIFNTEADLIQDQEISPELKYQNSNVKQIKQSTVSSTTEDEFWKKENIDEKNIDPLVLHVRNLPLTTTTEDLLELFPAYQKYQILPHKLNNNSSAFICFNSVHETIEAYKSTKSKKYKSQTLKVKFKCKNLIINPFALMKRKNNSVQYDEELKTKKTKLNCNSSSNNSTSDEEITIIDQENNELVNEDDIEFNSDSEVYDNDICVSPQIGTDEFEEDVTENQDCQDAESLDDNATFLPFDDDYE